MKRPKLNEMTIREKVGQTGMPGPGEVRKGIQRCGGYDKYFREFPFCGLYVDGGISDAEGNKFSSPQAISQALADASNQLDIPLLVSCDYEMGANTLFPELHRIPSNMAVGAAHSKELAFERGYLWAREMKSFGVNWPFAPVGDLVGNFFATSGVRCMSDDPELTCSLYPAMIQGIQAAGLAATAKHFPSGGRDYRDSHFCSTGISVTKEEWECRMKPVWKAAVDAGVLSFMVGHASFPAFDPSYARGKVPRPASASSGVNEILRKDLGFDGVVVTDAVSMKALASAFEHDDIYIECFNAGNDVILFVRDDYIDVMEKAVLDGRISMERLDRSVERILDLKEKLGLFDTEVKAAEGLSEEENRHFEEVNYHIAKNALTLLNNTDNRIPFYPEAIHKVTIIGITPDRPFLESLSVMAEAFEKRGIRANIVDGIKTKDDLKELAETEDLIIYACCLAQGFLKGMPFYATRENMTTLFAALSYGAEKTVVCSFDVPSLYYNYFETADMYINAYSSDSSTMRAFVDGILGDFAFTGRSPVALRPEFVNRPT